MGKTAEEFLKELSKNKKYQEEKKKREANFKEFEERLNADEVSLIFDLKSIGIHIDSVWDLVNSSSPYQEAIPILLKHLQMEHHPRTLEGIARSLAVPEALKFDNVWKIIFDLFLKADPDESIDSPEERGFKDGLAVAISVLYNESQIKDVLSLIQDKSHGKSRGLLVDGLKKFRDRPEIIELLKTIQKKDKLLKKCATEVLRGQK